MALLKKIFFALFVAAALAAGAWAYFSLKDNKKPGVEALSLLPDNCLLYVRSNNFFELNKKLNAQSLIADKLRSFTEVGALCSTLHLFDSLFQANGVLKEELDNNPVHVALYHGPQWLAAFNVKQLGGQQQTARAIAGIFRAVEANNVYTFRITTTGNLYFTVHNGVVLLSNNTGLLATSVKGAAPKLQHNKAFAQFKTTLNENAAFALFVNHSLYTQNAASQRLNLSLVNQSGYSAGAVDLEPSQLKINGFMKPGSSDLIAAFNEQKPQPTEFVNALPLNTIAFKAYGFSSYKLLKDELGKGDSAAAMFWKRINDTALYKLDEEFYLNANSFLLDFETAARHHYSALQVADTMMANGHLKAMSDSVWVEGADSLYRLGKNAGLKIFEPLCSNATHYAARHNACLYFAQNKDDLQQLLQLLNNGQLLSGDNGFMAYKNEHFYESFNYMVYNAPNRIGKEIAGFFNFSAMDKVQPFENFRHFSFSVAKYNDQFKFRFQLSNETGSNGNNKSNLWTLKLDTTSGMKAAGFVNHLTRENELLVQDDNNTLYLINAKGTVLWTKKLDEKINSPLFTVDLFKNNKYQILFSSANYLHLIDRNGKYVQGYPVKLPAEASSPLGVFDYEHNKDYRLFIACKNKLVYNYALAGTKQSGFVPFKLDHEVKLPIQYVKVGLSDYLVAVDVEGKIYTFSRRGDGRIGLANKATVACAGFYLDATNNINSTYLVYVDEKNNAINKISFADKKDLVKLHQNIEQGQPQFVTVGENKAAGFLLTKQNAVLLYDMNGNLLFEKEFDNESTASDIYSDESSAWLLVHSAAKQELTVFDQASGRSSVFEASALPLVSDLFNDHKKYLVITQGSKLSCVLLN